MGFLRIKVVAVVCITNDTENDVANHLAREMIGGIRDLWLICASINIRRRQLGRAVAAVLVAQRKARRGRSMTSRLSSSC